MSYEKEKKKNPELKDSDVQILKEWCAKQPHLPKISDFQYALFLHSNYYRMEPTKTTIEAYYTSRTHLPEFFCDRDPLGTKTLREAFKVTETNLNSATMTEHVMPVQYVGVEEECKRNPELKVSDLQMLKDWMDKQPHLPDIPIFYLIIFLHCNYYRIEPTKTTIENFFTVRTHMPEVFSNRDPVAWKELRKTFTVMTMLPLKERTKEDYIMTFGKFLNPSPNQFNFNECLKYLFMTCEVQNVIEGTSCGLVIILDATGFTLGHIARMNLMSLKKIMFFIQEAAPVRLKAIHVLNAIPAAETLLNMVKPFVKAELLSFIYFHPNIESARKHIPVEALPNEIGGQAGPIKDLINKHIKLLEEFRAWFLHDERVERVNESLRVSKFQGGDGLFGMDGSFKKLEID
ncbi:alpha-tocopherol transfer protein-like isoform X2 [Odontomachus brunneus]|nr:alpha-tocopherol transfer protein-like isoform X2 [Odontomachus brunneus]